MKKTKKIFLIFLVLFCVSLMLSPINAASHEINSSSYTNYFDEEGYIINKDVANGDTLEFTGTIENKNIKLDQALNVKGKEGNSLENVYIAFETGAKSSNVSKLNIINLNKKGISIYDDEINLFDNSIIVKNDNTEHAYGIHVFNSLNKITNNLIKATGKNGAYGIYLDTSNNNTIESNNITTNGTVLKVDWSNWMDGGVYETVPIVLKKSNNNTIKNNNLIADFNDFDGKQDTNVCMHLTKGRSENFINKNIMHVYGNDYVYGICVEGGMNADYSMNYAQDNIILDNDISSTSNWYANGIQVTAPSVTTIANNTIYCYATEMNYPIYLSNMMGPNTMYTEISVEFDGEEGGEDNMT